ncbi:MAG TPA: carboxymuconolactone decarboxylase family protein [Polyangiaceae bacterium]|jgi:AhpD family alkylhydroperoxidase|nr:carboxymuconolactone decarboxylase family protein [Polyangiaceae bacterium]
MTRSFVAYDLNSAPAAARPILEENRKKFGKIAAPLARYAASPVTLQAALAGLSAFEQSSLQPLEREVLAMVMAHKNGCDYCVRLHRRLLGMLDAPPGSSEALERGAPLESPRLEALRGFILALLERTGDVGSEAWRAFLAAGYDRAAALDVVLGISAYTLTTFANRLTEAPLD